VQGANSKAGQTVAADVSFFYQKKDIAVGDRDATFAFGLNVSNIGAKMSYTETANKDFIPINLRLGPSFKLELDEYNSIAVGATLTIVAPALAGLTVTNPVYADGTWITSAGADDESDASLRARCRARWGTLGRGANDAAYRYLARTGHAYETSVTRAYVVWGAGDGTLTVYLAGPSGAVNNTVVTAVQAWIDENKPGTDSATVASVVNVPVTVAGTIYLPAAYDTTANRTLATDALGAYFAGLDVGQDPDLGAIYHALYSAAGITDIDLTSPSGDTAVNNGHVATLVTSLTWTAT
jgi:phage-related baseplate assembly protein